MTLERTKEKPTQVGWYWFRADESSPNAMQQGLWVVVLVGYIATGATHNERLVVRFSRGTYYVSDMGGEWSSTPIPYPPQ